MGADPRFNSVHLDSTRRQDYRRAHEALLDCRGAQTLYAEHHPAEGANPSATFIRHENAAGEAPLELQYWLVDRDFIYPLAVGVNTMGRSANNNIVVEDLYISRRHCAILVHHDRCCELHDTASKNGTLINGQKMRGPTPLKSGDEIRICNRQFVFLARTHDQGPPSPGTGNLGRSARDGGPPTHTILE